MVPSRELVRKIADWIRNPVDSARRFWRRVRPMRRDYRARFRMSLKDWMVEAPPLRPVERRIAADYAAK